MGVGVGVGVNEIEEVEEEEVEPKSPWPRFFLPPLNPLPFLTPWGETLAVGADHQNLRHSKNPAAQKAPPKRTCATLK